MGDCADLLTRNRRVTNQCANSVPVLLLTITVHLLSTLFTAPERIQHSFRVSTVLLMSSLRMLHKLGKTYSYILKNILYKCAYHDRFKYLLLCSSLEEVYRIACNDGIGGDISAVSRS